MAAGANEFPLPKFFFEVEIGGAVIPFQEVSGLDQEADVLEYRHGDAKDFVTQKRLGMVKTSTISMKKGIFSDDTDLNDLFKKIYDKDAYFSQVDAPDLLQITVKLKDEKEKDVVVWKIKNAVPIKFVGTDLKSDANEVAIEQIDFVHMGIEIE
jgi:phage tail-like protein